MTKHSLDRSLIEKIGCNKNYAAIPGKNHNRSDQELHYHFVHFPSREIYEFQGSLYNTEALTNLSKWYSRTSEIK